jgi:hypothetical protein
MLKGVRERERSWLSLESAYQTVALTSTLQNSRYKIPGIDGGAVWTLAKLVLTEKLPVHRSTALGVVVECPIFLWVFLQEQRSSSYVLIELILALNFRSLKYSIFQVPPINRSSCAL